MRMERNFSPSPNKLAKIKQIHFQWCATIRGETQIIIFIIRIFFFRHSTLSSDSWSAFFVQLFFLYLNNLSFVLVGARSV